MKIDKPISIGDISISLNLNPELMNERFVSRLRSFCNGFGTSRDRISICTANTHKVDLREYCETYDNFFYELWKMWKAKDGSSYLITLYRGRHNPVTAPYRVLTVNNTFSDMQVAHLKGVKPVHPIDYLFTLILAGYLNVNRKGLLLHAAMAMVDGKACVFSGLSGDGKTTLSKLLIRDKGAEVITDERVIVREKRGMIYAFGTPWYGTAALQKNKGAPVHKIYFLKHGTKNTLRRLSASEATIRFIVRCFPAFWHKEGMQFVLDFCARIASEVECYEFGFVPDKTAVEFLEKAILS